MASGPAFNLDGIDGPVACRQWLQGLPQEPGARMQAVGSLFDRIAGGAFGPDVAFELAELGREVVLADAQRLLARTQGVSVPFAGEHLCDYVAAVTALERLHRTYRSVYTQMVEADSLDTRSVIPGATNAMRVVMPLARGLDALSRRLVAAMQCRVQVEPEDWRELATMARHMRRTTFIDEPLIDRVALHRPATARAAVTYPLLLCAAGIEDRTGPRARLVEKLARRWAGKVGFRFDRGDARADSPQGPLIALTPILSVRLDTHRLQRSLEARREDWLSEARAAGRAVMGLEREDLAEFLDELALDWSGRKRIRTMQPSPPAPVRLRVGMPASFRSEVEFAERGNDPGLTDASYSYGRWEQNTIIRMAFGQGAQPADPLAVLVGDAEQARRVGADGDLCFVDRRAMTPHLRGGDLVALFDGPAPGEGAPLVRLARVASVRQIAPVGRTDGASHRVALRSLPGRAVPVGVRGAGSAAFVDAFLLEPGEHGEHSLVVAAGLLAAGAALLVRRGGRDLRARIGARLDAGRDEERYSLRFERD